MASLTKSHPSPSVDLTLLEICLPFRPFFIAGNPSVLPPDLHCRKSICLSVHSSLPEICLPFRPIFIAGNPFALPPILHYWKAPVADGDGADARQRVQLPFDLLHIVLAADATHGKAGACFRHCHHPSISMGEISTSLVQEATRGFITTMG